MFSLLLASALGLHASPGGPVVRGGPGAVSDSAAVVSAAAAAAAAAAAPSRAASSARMALKLDMDPTEMAQLLEEGPAASQGPFGKGGALEWLANILDKAAEDTLTLLHAADDKAVQDSSKNLQVLWSRAVLAKNGELKDSVAFEMLPESTRGTVTAGLFDGTPPLPPPQ